VDAFPKGPLGANLIDDGPGKIPLILNISGRSHEDPVDDGLNARSFTIGSFICHTFIHGVFFVKLAILEA